MNDVKINKNKKIYFLNILCMVFLILQSITCTLYFIYLLHEFHNSIFLIIIILLVGSILHGLIKNFLEKIMNKLIKKEYIKENKSIGYLKYIPEEEIGNIQNYIQENKKDLELKYEEELLKKQISNF